MTTDDRDRRLQYATEGLLNGRIDSAAVLALIDIADTLRRIEAKMAQPQGPIEDDTYRDAFEEGGRP